MASRWWGDVTRVPEETGETGIRAMGWRAWGRAIARTLKGAAIDDFGIVASSIAFAAFLSILPLLSLVALTYGLAVPRAVVADNVSTLIGILPHGAQRLVGDWLINSLTRRSGNALALLFSGALTLFSARRAGRSLLHGINVASGIEQDRATLARQIVSLLVVLALAALLLTALVSITALTLLQRLVPDNLPAAAEAFQLLLFGSLTLGPVAALTLIYRYAPARQPIGWRCVLPGALAAVLMWIAATLGFEFYVAHLASYDDTYGSLSAVIVLELWLMLSAFILLLGARLNAELRRSAGAPK